MKDVGELKKHYIRTYSEVLEKLRRKLETLEIPPPPKKLRTRIGWARNIYLKRIELVHNVLQSEIDRVLEALSTVEQLHPFYRELFIVKTGEPPGKLRRLYRGKKRIIGMLYSKYRAVLKNAETEYELKIKYREALGRMLSVIKRHQRLLTAIKNAVIEISHLPSIGAEDYKVIVAGMPQVGKSTLISKLSTAKPEIAHYPFTTKTIIVGHLIREPYYRITFIDTPGLLDRPLSERNEIELKAVLALKHLADKIVYLVDASPNTYYTLEEQINVLRDVERIVGGNIVVCINKIDITPPHMVKEAREKLEEAGYSNILEISAAKGMGLDKLLEEITKPLTQRLQHI